MKYVKNEIAIMKKLKSQNIVQLIEDFEDNNFVYIVLEYCEQGTLFNYIINNKPNEAKCIEIFI